MFDLSQAILGLQENMEAVTREGGAGVKLPKVTLGFPIEQVNQDSLSKII